MTESEKTKAEKISADFNAAIAALRMATAGDTPAPGIKADPEDQLKTPVTALLKTAGAKFNLTIETRTEARHAETGTRPDIVVVAGGLLCGHAELKASGKGANPKQFRGHDQEQWKKFHALKNLIYTDGRDWSLARDGKIEMTARTPEAGESSANLQKLLRGFLQWKPIVPAKPRLLAEYLAPLCRLIRDDTRRALQKKNSAIAALATEWRGHFFPEADDARFADAYAQTLTYALLLARLEGAKGEAMDAAVDKLEARNNLLAQALRILGQKEARDEIGLGVDLLERSLRALDLSNMRTRLGASALFDYAPEMWLYFYEDFLAAYDPKLKKDAGVYYTPPQVVNCQVRLVSELLRKEFGRPFAFADENVTFIDPAAGTGTYLIAAVQHSLNLVGESQGPGAVAARATQMARNMFGFEILMGPYAVAHLRLSQEFRHAKAELPPDGLRFYLADTLSSPYTTPPGAMDLTHRALAKERENARKVKAEKKILACIGNPPYDRQTIEQGKMETRKGGWVRYGRDDKDAAQSQESPLLEDFLKPASKAGYGSDLANIYNDYIYFWRWALWKMFETHGDGGIVSFITASSYLSGNAFVGMREMMRRTFDKLWIIDLGGEGRGARREQNVFNIQTPVAIAIGFRKGRSKSKAADVYYARIEGTRKDKFGTLDSVNQFTDLQWQICPANWHAPFIPQGEGDYFDWPKFVDIFPSWYSGVKFQRTWPIGETKGLLQERWSVLMAAKNEEKRQLFKETRDRKINQPYRVGKKPLLPLSDMGEKNAPPEIIPYGARPFDRQYAILDNRLCDLPRPELQATQSDKQIFMITLLATQLSEGPAATMTFFIPDMHYFRGSYGGQVVPLWKDSAATKPNVAEGLLGKLADIYGEKKIAPEDLFAYCYALLAAPDYTKRFYKELETPGPHVPLTRDSRLFNKAARLGRRLIWLHTDGERMPPSGDAESPKGKAKWIKGVPGDEDNYPDKMSYDPIANQIAVGGGRIGPVANEVWEFEVSGYKVVQRWIKQRLKKGAGKKSSPLDSIRPRKWDFRLDDDLLHLLWKIENTVTMGGMLSGVLGEIVEGECIAAAELPPSVTAKKNR